MQTQDISNSVNVDEELDLSQLIKALIKGKWFIIIFTTVVSIASVFYSLSLPNIYKSEALLAPVSTKDSVSGSMDNLSGLASLAGISFSDSSDTSSVALQKMTSLSFFEEKILPKINLPDLFAVEAWNRNSNLITYDKEIYDVTTDKWNREPSFDSESSVPTSQESFRLFLEHLDVFKDLKTSFVTVGVKHQSPHVAKEWADIVVGEINQYYREKDRSEAEFAVQYLNQEISATRLSEVRLVIGQVLEKQIQKLALIEANINYVFDYIDPPAVMQRKSSPVRSMICIVGAFLGLFLSSVIVLFREFRPISLKE